MTTERPLDAVRTAAAGAPDLAVPNERTLSSVLREFARTMVTDFPIQSILDHLVERIVDVLPVTAAGVTLISDDADPREVAASDEDALRFEQLQTGLGEGPCLVAYRTGEAVAVPDLRATNAYPTFAPQAVDAGLAAVFTFPLHHGDARLGALDLYRDTPGPLGDAASDAAQTLADVAAAYILNARARAELRAASDRSLARAMHDPLTGLPNRVLLRERLDHAVARCTRSEKVAGLLFADLDEFKAVNDIHGHRAGDELLVQVAQRLATVIRPGDTLARLSGDEFVVLCEDLDDASEADDIAARLVDAMEPSFVVAGVQVRLSLSVGIAFSREGAVRAEQLLDTADAAMYEAKRVGGGHHRRLDRRAPRRIAERVSLHADLRGALGRGELRTEYQPITAVSDGELTGVEVLPCWDHPTCGLVPSTVLTPLVEHSGLRDDIGRWVLERCCADLPRWQRPGHEVTVTMGVAAHRLVSRDFVDGMASVLEATATDPRLLTLKINERVFVQDSDRALEVLADLERLGVQLALEGYGTGHAAIDLLRRLPIDVVMIDGMFVAELPHDEPSTAFVGAVVQLAHGLGMVVVAEGVETAEQHEALAALACDRCQGSYVSGPRSAVEIEGLVTA